mmetsp:Transcript_35475/g.75753  ORF Transcript_35475/g.75753 Transcript_35475/m.75753 type:complete len:390 (+) Transcript_35475:200-1369(+)
MNHIMQFTHLVIALVATLSLVAPADGLVLSRLPNISAHFPQSVCNRNMVLKSTTASSVEVPIIESQRNLTMIQSKIVKTLMVAYIASMCVALPVTLFPVYLLYKLKLIDRTRKENWSLKVGQFCSRWIMRIFPFASKRVVANSDDEQLKNPEPCIWVCNHISMLDVFFVLALDKKMRGINRRPIKILYWKGLEANPVTGLLFKMCGFIPVDMLANGNGNANEYDPKSFKQMLKSTKAAMDEGFDIGILPEGQPNPTPEEGLQPIYSGAFTLARMSRRPIKLMCLYGLHKMWHPDENIGMKCDAREMAVRVYPGMRVFKDAEEFTSTFEAVVGHFGAHGYDLPDEELSMWLDGSMWQTELSRRAATRLAAEDIAQGEKSNFEIKNTVERS